MKASSSGLPSKSNESCFAGIRSVPHTLVIKSLGAVLLCSAKHEDVANLVISVCDLEDFDIASCSTWRLSLLDSDFRTLRITDFWNLS